MPYVRSRAGPVSERPSNPNPRTVQHKARPGASTVTMDFGPPWLHLPGLPAQPIPEALSDEQGSLAQWITRHQCGMRCGVPSNTEAVVG
jgi:hypothetical protein